MRKDDWEMLNSFLLIYDFMMNTPKYIFSKTIGIFFLLLLASSCKNTSDEKIETTLNNFFESMYARDFNKARSYATVESDEVIDLLENIADVPPMEPLEKPNISISSIKIDQDTLATAVVKASGEPNSVKLSLKKRAGTWLVAFDFRSLAVMLGQDPDEAEMEMAQPPSEADDSVLPPESMSDINKNKGINRPPLNMIDTTL